MAMQGPQQHVTAGTRVSLFGGMCSVKMCFVVEQEQHAGLWSVTAFAGIRMLPTFSPGIYSTISVYCELVFCD